MPEMVDIKLVKNAQLDGISKEKWFCTENDRVCTLKVAF